MKKRIIFIWNCFCMITACTLTATALFTTLLFPTESISPYTLWQVLITSFLCALSALLYPWERTMKKTEFRIRVCVHYILINIIVLSFGWRFEWYQPTHLRSILSMLITIAVIFCIVSLISWTRSAKDAKKMNERLEEYQKNLYDKEFEE